MTDTSGFYRNEDGALSYGVGDIEGPFGILRRAEQTTYTYPVEGWNWFDSEELARLAYHLPPPEPIVEPEPLPTTP